MYSLSLLKVKDPGCFFCEILKEGSSKAYEDMSAELNSLYSTVYRNVEELKPSSLVVGTCCIVFYEKLKSWCRAILESTTCSEELVECFLVDYAVYSPIKKTNIRIPLEQFHKLPFRARKFKLHRVRPVSLQIDLLKNKSELRPAKRWDIAAIHYFQQLLQDALKIEAQLCSSEDGCLIITLYVTTADSVICVNDDLVVKKYACYENGNPRDLSEKMPPLASAAVKAVSDSYDKKPSVPQSEGQRRSASGNVVDTSAEPIESLFTKSLILTKAPRPPPLLPPAWSNTDVKIVHTEAAENPAAKMSAAVKAVSDSYDKKPSVPQSEGQRRSASGNVVDSSAEPIESLFTKSLILTKAPRPPPLLPPAWSNTDVKIVHTEAAENPAAKMSAAVKAVSESYDEKPSVPQSEGQRRSASGNVVDSSAEPIESLFTKSLILTKAPRPPPLLPPAWSQTDVKIVHTEAAENPAAKMSAAVKAVTDSYDKKPSVPQSEGQRRSASGNVVDTSAEPIESLFTKSLILTKAPRPPPLLPPAWSQTDVKIVHTEAAENPAAKMRNLPQHSLSVSTFGMRKNGGSDNGQSRCGSDGERAGPTAAAATTNLPQHSLSVSTFGMRKNGGSDKRQTHCGSDGERAGPTAAAATTNLPQHSLSVSTFGMRKNGGSDNGQTRCGSDSERAGPTAAAATTVDRSEKLHQSKQEPQTSKSNSGGESNPSHFVWPAWSSRDRERRLSGELTEKSLAKLSSAGEKKTKPMKEADTKQALTRLLHFLNPTPKELQEEESIQPPKIKPQSAVFASHGLPPISTLEEATLSEDIIKRLGMCGYDGPHLTESYCWLPIAEGFDTIVISPHGSRPISYIPPLLSHLHLASVVYKLLPAKHGPHAVILCPGWNKAHSVYNMLMELSKNVRPLSPMLLLVGLKKEELEGLKPRKHCEVLVTTPQCLLRYLKHHGLLLLRLCHLVFDEVDSLFSKAGSEMSEILQIYKKIVNVENRNCSPQQIVAIGSKWTEDMRLLLQYMTAPRIVITSMEQAAVFANVQQVAQLCLDCEKLSTLVSCFDFTPVNAQKILIFTKTNEEAELVHTAVQTASVYSLLLHNGVFHLLNHVLQQWRKSLSGRTVLVLVVTDDYAPLLEITDATCVIHYSYPENVGVLSHRLFSLLDYIQSRIDKISLEEDDHSRAKSILIMTEKHASCGLHLLRSLRQAQAVVPPELVALTQGLLQNLQNKKSDRELCLSLKAFGYCNFSLPSEEAYACPRRHHINPSLDLHDGVAAIPESDQYMMVLPLCIVDAARFLGRVVTKNDPYDKLAAELNEFYESPTNNIPARNVQCKHLYAISDGSEYHRVQVLSTEITDSVSYAHVQYVDDGKADKIPVHRLFLLPPAFQSVPQQVREFIVCRVKPIDNEDTWDPKVARVISRSIRGKPHRAKVVLQLGNTYWLDPMVQMTALSDLSSYTYDLNVRKEILSTGLATDNPQHILQLKALLEPIGSSPVCGRRDEDENIAIPGKSSEDDSMSAAPCLEKADSDYKKNVVGDDLSTHCDGEKEQPKEIAAHGGSEPLGILPSTSFYPQVKWFEKADTVTLTVKLQQVTDPKCVFYSDRLVFSCFAGGKLYGADMELYKDIVRDNSNCTLKNGEAVITIQKSKAEMWNRLLKNKHPNVSFDFDHLEESEDIKRVKSGFKSTMTLYNVVAEDEMSSEDSESDSD